MKKMLRLFSRLRAVYGAECFWGGVFGVVLLLPAGLFWTVFMVFPCTSILASYHNEIYEMPSILPVVVTTAGTVVTTLLWLLLVFATGITMGCATGLVLRNVITLVKAHARRHINT